MFLSSLEETPPTVGTSVVALILRVLANLSFSGIRHMFRKLIFRRPSLRLIRPLLRRGYILVFLLRSLTLSHTATHFLAVLSIRNLSSTPMLPATIYCHHQI
jgi:hypothetical protein